MIARIVPFLAALVVIAPLAAAEASFRDGLEAYRQGDHPRAAELWQEAAEAGDPAAQRNLGLMYLKGVGVRRDEATAADWFARAAEQGFAPAAANLADLYLNGRGVEADATEAFRYLRIAAEGGLAESMYNLGVLYQHGFGTEPDREAAVHWFRRADEFGYERAAAKLSELGADRQEAQPAPADSVSKAPSPPVELTGGGNGGSVASAPPAPNTEITNDGLVDHLVVLFSPDL